MRNPEQAKYQPRGRSKDEVRFKMAARLYQKQNETRNCDLATTN